MRTVDFHVRQDVFRGECFAVLCADVNGARVAFAVCDVEVLLAVRFLADFQAGVGKLVAGICAIGLALLVFGKSLPKSDGKPVAHTESETAAEGA